MVFIKGKMRTVANTNFEQISVRQSVDFGKEFFLLGFEKNIYQRIQDSKTIVEIG